MFAAGRVLVTVHGVCVGGSLHPKNSMKTVLLHAGNGGNVSASVAVVGPKSSQKVRGPCTANTALGTACPSWPPAILRHNPLVEITELGKADQTISKTGGNVVLWVSACDTRRL